MSQGKEILVHAHWHEFDAPLQMGVLTAISSRGKEMFSFEYSKEWLSSNTRPTIDPDMQFYAGRYFPQE